MVDPSIEEQMNEESVPAIERHEALVGFLPFEDAYRHVKRSEATWDTGDEELSEEEQEEVFKERHEKAVESIESLDVVTDQITYEPLPDDPAIKDHVEEFKQTILFERFSQRIEDSDWEIALVPLEQITPRHPMVSAAAYEDLPSWDDDPVDVLEYTLPTERKQLHFHQGIQTPDDRLLGVQFTNRSPNVDVSQMRVVEGDDPMEKRVVFDVRAKSNFVRLADIDGRCVVQDGHHRLTRLAEQGETHVPAVVQQVPDYSMIKVDSDFDSDTIFADRPPVMTDFTTDAAMSLSRPATNTVIQITAETFSVVR